MEELEERIEELESEKCDLECEVDELRNEMEKQISEYEDKLDGAILDVVNFKRQLEIKGLITKEIDEFIDDYMRWSNA